MGVIFVTVMVDSSGIHRYTLVNGDIFRVSRVETAAVRRALDKKGREMRGKRRRVNLMGKKVANLESICCY